MLLLPSYGFFCFTSILPPTNLSIIDPLSLSIMHEVSFLCISYAGYVPKANLQISILKCLVAILPQTNKNSSFETYWFWRVYKCWHLCICKNRYVFMLLFLYITSFWPFSLSLLILVPSVILYSTLFLLPFIYPSSSHYFIFTILWFQNWYTYLLPFFVKILHLYISFSYPCCNLKLLLFVYSKWFLKTDLVSFINGLSLLFSSSSSTSKHEYRFWRARSDG